MTNSQEDRLIASMRLLLGKMENQRYYRINGDFPTTIRRQFDSIVNQVLKHAGSL